MTTDTIKLKVSAALKTYSHYDFSVEVHYDVEDANTGKAIAGINVYVLFDRDDTITISDAVAKGIERAREILSTVVSHEQSDRVAINDNLYK
ncbi:MAG: hypothetical protein AABN33_13830 [Acidobacteriota bacterium]